MQTIEMSDVVPTIKSVLAMGMEGAGKTHFIGTFPKPILVYSFDNGYQTLAGMDGIRVKAFVEKERRRPVAAKEFEAEFAKLLNGQEPMYKWANGKEERFKTVGIDPLSFWSMQCMNKVQFDNRTSDTKPTYAEWDVILKRGMDLLGQFLRVTSEQGMFLVATCHVKIDRDEDTGQLWFLPDMLGSVREKLGAWFDMVAYLKVDKKPSGDKEYQMCTVGERRERARLRLPSSLDGVVKAVDVPDFSAIQRRIEERYAAAKQGGK